MNLAIDLEPFPVQPQPLAPGALAGNRIPTTPGSRGNDLRLNGRRLDGSDLLHERTVPLRATVRGEIEHALPAMQA